MLKSLYAKCIYYRWDQNKGNEVNKQSTYWQDDEPNVEEFDYDTRLYSPITKEGIEKCSSNPAFTCTIPSDDGIECDQSSTFFQPSNLIGDISDLEDAQTICKNTGGCEVPNDALFVKFDLIKATTNDAKPACMAITSPNVFYQETDPTYDKCRVTFDFAENNLVERYLYAKWLDLKCNQRTRALMCTVIGIRILKQS